MSIDKQFHGDLEATSKGEMLSAGIDVKGSAGCVANRASQWGLARTEWVSTSAISGLTFQLVAKTYYLRDCA
jgi:hypothetical protein